MITQPSTFSASPTANRLGLLAILVVGLTLANVKLPLISSLRSAVLLLGAIGFALCSTGALGKIIASSSYTSPAFITGVLLGTLALLLLILLVGFGAKLPFLPPLLCASVVIFPPNLRI